MVPPTERIISVYKGYHTTLKVILNKEKVNPCDHMDIATKY
tara:strand:+ start:4367 stop:4489 length:123 start_codon:yes stop_codon:yes gene_type:complete